MALFAGLYPFEVVLMVLGIVFFLALLVALLRNVFKDKPFAPLLPAFLIPVIMVGYPSIKSFQYQGVIVQIQQLETQVAADPSSPQAQAQLRLLSSKLKTVAPRAVNDPAATAIVQDARRLIARAPHVTPTLPATSVQARQVEELAQTLRTQPHDAEARNNLIAAINKLKSTATNDPTAQAAIQHGEEALKAN